MDVLKSDLQHYDAIAEESLPEAGLLNLWQSKADEDVEEMNKSVGSWAERIQAQMRMQMEGGPADADEQGSEDEDEDEDGEEKAESDDGCEEGDGGDEDEGGNTEK